MTDLARIKRNVARMVEQGAPEEDVAAYVASENTTADELRKVDRAGYMAARAEQEKRQAPAPVKVGGMTLPGDRRGAFGGFTDQVLNNLGIGDEIEGAGAATVQAGRNIAAALAGRPQTASVSDAFEAASDVRKRLGRQYAKQAPIANAVATGAGVAVAGKPTTVGMTAAPPQAMGAAQAAGLAGLVNAPFALARQEGTLQERLPGAAVETATGMALAGGLQAGVNRLVQPRNAQAAQRAQQFEQAGVRPTWAGVTGSETGGVAKAISENWMFGGGARRNLQNSLDDTANAARQIGQQYGQARGAQIAGDEVAGAVTNFARNADDPRSFPARSERLYDQAFGRINAGAAGLQGVNQRPPLVTQNTLQTLADIETRVRAPNLAGIVNDPQIGRIMTALRSDQGAIQFGDLRALRTWVRTAQRDPAIRQGIDAASLQRLESALTRDINTSARQIGGDAAERALRRADQFYRTGSQRLKQIDQRFGVMSDRVSAENLYSRIKNVASSGAKADVDSLAALRRTVPADVWGDVSATLIDDMGRLSAGTPGVMQDEAFSVTRFVTEYAKMSPAARDILFGATNTPLRSSLDNLAQVADFQRGVERAANASRSGVSAQNVTTISGLGGAAYAAATGNPALLGTVAAGGAGMMLTGEMLTNPAFVRWLAGAPRAGQTVGGWRAHVAQLGQIAARDPALTAYYSQLISPLREMLDRPPQQSPNSRPVGLLTAPPTTGQSSGR